MVRVKSRYIAFRVLYPECGDEILLKYRPTDSDVTGKIILQKIKEQININFGDAAMGRISGSLNLRYFSNKTSLGILKMNFEEYKMVCFAIMMVNKLEIKQDNNKEEEDIIIQIIRSSGTMTKLQTFLINEDKKIVNEYLAKTI